MGLFAFGPSSVANVNITITSSTFSTNGSSTGYGIEAWNASGTFSVTSSTFLNNLTAAAYLDFNSGINFVPSGNVAVYHQNYDLGNLSQSVVQ